MAGENQFNRRDVLRTTASGFALAGGAGAISRDVRGEKESSETIDDPMERKVLDGPTKAWAIWEALRSLRSSDLERQMAAAEYETGIRGSKAVKVQWEGTRDWTTYAFVPLLENGTRIPSALTHDTDDTDGIANYVWSDDDSRDDFIIRTGSFRELVPTEVHASEDTPNQDADTIEVITESGHSVSAYSGGDVVTKTEVDVTTGNVAKTTLGAEDVEASDFCPDTVAGIVTAIGTCGSGCALCTTVSVGDWPAIFACLACSGCSCGLGCCLGRAVGSDVCNLATVYAAGGILISPAQAAGAACVVSGCNGAVPSVC